MAPLLAGFPQLWNLWHNIHKKEEILSSWKIPLCVGRSRQLNWYWNEVKEVSKETHYKSAFITCGNSRTFCIRDNVRWKLIFDTHLYCTHCISICFSTWTCIKNIISPFLLLPWHHGPIFLRDGSMKSVFNHQINQTPTVEIVYTSELLFQLTKSSIKIEPSPLYLNFYKNCSSGRTKRWLQAPY